MGKSKIVLLTMHKIYKDKSNPSKLDTIPLGVYKKFSKRLTENIDYGVFRLLKNINDNALDIISKDNSILEGLYSRTANCFYHADKYGTAYAYIYNTRKFEEILIQVAVLDLENCEDCTLSYWLAASKEPNISYNKRSKRYELPKPKKNNTHYTN